MLRAVLRRIDITAQGDVGELIGCDDLRGLTWEDLGAQGIVFNSFTSCNSEPLEMSLKFLMSMCEHLCTHEKYVSCVEV